MGSFSFIFRKRERKKKRMQIKFKIHDDEWVLEVISGDSIKMNPNEDVVNLGSTEILDHKIYIRDGMDQITTEQTIVHELVHAFIFSYGYTIENEEEACNFFGSQAEHILKIKEGICQKLI